MRIVGQDRVAEVFGVAPKTIVEWQEQGFPIALRGRPGVPSEYDTAACIAWYVEREVRKVQNEQPRDRLARVQAEKIEMENAVTRGLLIPADQLEPKLRAVMVAIREQLLDLRRTLTPQLAGRTPREIEQALEAAHSEALHRLAKWRQADRDDEEESPAA
jgi:terminase small subunit / prophage DNA-packing protein